MMSIRSKIAALALLFVATTTAVAQESKFPRLLIGPTGGINLTSLIFQPNVEQTLKMGYDGGIVIRYDVDKDAMGLKGVDAGIWLEIDYSSRGWHEKPEEHPDYYYERTLNFINVPFMTQFLVGQGPFKFTVNMGAQFGYLLSEQSSTNFPEEGVPVVTEQHNMPVENKFAWGLGGGIGGEYHFGKVVAGLRGSYVYGLGEIYGNSRKDYFGKSSEQIISAKLYLLYAF
ncbi:MAG: porin family protein [Porphyromonas sp.]|nr:porin family protein [Porphyromonas sp.]